jgi:hypothetical protein
VAEPIGDFWPANIGETNIVTPLTLLKQEASYLGPKTKQLVSADVTTNSLGDGRLNHVFTLIVPGLNNYKYGLFQVTHAITLYPVQVSWINQSATLATQEQLIDKLREIISSDSTKKIVEALLAQVSGPASGQ